jgi:sodium-dependent dicarboxylate transporter 2/3/5
LTRHEIPVVGRTSIRQWLVGAHNARPGLIILGVVLFAAIVAAPGPKGLLELLSREKTGEAGEKITGYSDYRSMQVGETISEYYSQKAKLDRKIVGPDGETHKRPLTPRAAAFRARVMIGTLVVAALFWASGAIPIGITALLVGAMMILFGVLPPSLAAQAYAKDSVVFIFGVLAISAAVSKTGLDRRIAILLLGSSTSLARLTFLFAPLLAVTASFFSEHALVAFLAPMLLMVYVGAVRSAGLKSDRALLVLMMLLLTYSANLGGPGSPAAGGRNAVMLGILADYGASPTFGEWVKMGLPFVPVATLAVAAYFYFIFRSKMQIKQLNVAAEVKREAEKIGKMTAGEYKAAGALILLIAMWVLFSNRLGMGGPALICLVLMNVMGVVRWRDINGIHWDVVALYAAASAMGYGLAVSGAALWLADGIVVALPDYLKSGMGLCVSSSLITGVLTNFMSDGATVAAVGPITVPMATLSGTSPVMVGLSTAFASSFAHMLIIGTPNNAICYAMAKDPDTGEQLLTMKDFLVHGSAVLVISFAVLWFWVFLGYWQWL